MKLEEFLKKALNVKTVKATSHYGGGCISQGQTFEIDNGQKIFVKQNSDKNVSKHRNYCISIRK